MCLCSLRFKKHIIFHILYIIVAPLCPSVARLGGFQPNWAVLNLIVRVNIGLGGWTKFGLVFGQFGGFQNI